MDISTEIGTFNVHTPEPSLYLHYLSLIFDHRGDKSEPTARRP